MTILQNLHAYTAYIVLAVLLFAVLNAWTGWLSKREFTLRFDRKLSLWALLLSHIQLLIGLLLYFVSASGFNALQMLGIGGLNAPARLLALEHPLINILAIVLITIGWAKHKRAAESSKKFKHLALFYGLGLVFIISRIPWAQWFA